MRIALIADAFPPLRSSGAVQLRDLSREFVNQGHQVTVLTPAPEQAEPWTANWQDGVEVVRLQAWQTKDVGYARRAVSELLMPYLMLHNFKASPAWSHRFDGVVWYSPSIFLGPLVKALKRQNSCPSYLILRDIFPEWMADMGLMRRGPAYHVFKGIAAYQYSVADTIGVQTPGNLAYFEDRRRAGGSVEVLQNWLQDSDAGFCSIDVSATTLAGRRIMVYAGNMGVAQGAHKLLGLADRISDDPRVGFVFVGRGSDVGALRDEAARRGLNNVLFFDEIDPDEIPGLYSQSSIGLVTLDARHKTHNIPGKFISYMHAGLPVLASINPGNDLEALIEAEGVGRVSTDAEGGDLPELARALLDGLALDDSIGERCRALAKSLFSSQAAVGQIARALAI